MISGIKVGSWVKIDWRDACGGAGWQTLRSFKRGLPKHTKVISFGKLVEINNDYLIYATGINGTNKLLQRPGFIPMSLVLNIQRVEPVRNKRQSRKKG